MQDKDKLSHAVARTILHGFERHFDIFLKITSKAKSCFEESKWQEIQTITKERLYFYDIRVKESVLNIQKKFDTNNFKRELWRQIKFEYIKLIHDHSQPELAETFFNSIFCKLFDKKLYKNEFIFIRPTINTDYIDLNDPIIKSYYVYDGKLDIHFENILKSMNFNCKYINFANDIQRLASEFNNNIKIDINRPFEIQIIKHLFFRNKAAYIIGTIINRNGRQPLCIVLLNDKKNGLYVDALLMKTAEISAIFSFTRAYFLVEFKFPSAVVEFLQKILPSKTTADLYSSIGLHKQGKTLLYRMFLRHMRTTKEILKVAPGITGMVMLVLTFPVYPYVFKIIRDKFKPPKNSNREAVKEKYRMVKNHDRVGRLADTWEFSDVGFPIDKIDKKLLAELKTETASSIEINDNTLIIKHLYIEQKMQPLDIYLKNADDKEIDHIIKDYGDTIKELINANIFPGDMLLKNFGVTRQNKVVFYDYDEITSMSEVNFRKIPQAQTMEQEMASEPWYHISPNDVFPEEFCKFLFSKKEIEKVFLKYHHDLLDANYWKNVQKNIVKGKISDVFPYNDNKRMHNIYKKDKKYEL